jgi:hypothetical protein
MCVKLPSTVSKVKQVALTPSLLPRLRVPVPNLQSSDKTAYLGDGELQLGVVRRGLACGGQVFAQREAPVREKRHVLLLLPLVVQLCVSNGQTVIKTCIGR